MDEKEFKLHLIETPEDKGSHFKIRFEIKVEDNVYWYHIYIRKKYITHINSDWVLLKPEAKSVIFRSLEEHKFATVRYNAKYYPDKIQLL